MAGIWWLASYPKSGNTWLRVALASLLSGRPADINAMPLVSLVASNRALFDNALGIESADLTIEQETNLRPRAYEIWAAEAAAADLLQNARRLSHDAGRRAAVSHRGDAWSGLYRARSSRRRGLVRPSSRQDHRRDDRPHGRSGSRAFGLHPAVASATGRAPRRWRDHVESWLGAPFPVHLLRYEDMHRDPHAAFTAVAAFLGLPTDRERIAAAVDAAASPVCRRRSVLRALSRSLARPLRSSAKVASMDGGGLAAGAGRTHRDRK